MRHSFLTNRFFLLSHLVGLTHSPRSNTSSRHLIRRPLPFSWPGSAFSGRSQKRGQTFSAGWTGSSFAWWVSQLFRSKFRSMPPFISGDMTNHWAIIIIMNVKVAWNSGFVFVVWFQCQKFGQFSKDDPNSFRLSESLSLYPQVKHWLLQFNSYICDIEVYKNSVWSRSKEVLIVVSRGLKFGNGGKRMRLLNIKRRRFK